MYILTIETTGKLGSVSLIDGQGHVLGEKTADDPMSHLKSLVPMICQLLDETGIEKNQLTHIAASIGPGSFTGIRIGVSTARALCQSLDLSGVAVPTLESFLRKKEALCQGQDTAVCAIINARRGQVYGVIDGYLKPQPRMITDIVQTIQEQIFPSKKSVIFFGDGIDAYQRQIEEGLSGMGKYIFADKSCRYQDAVSAGILAFDLIKEGKTADYEHLVPDYMRKAEAEQKLEAGELPICKGPRQE